jgi:hypothetical protein
MIRHVTVEDRLFSPPAIPARNQESLDRLCDQECLSASAVHRRQLPLSHNFSGMADTLDALRKLAAEQQNALDNTKKRIRLMVENEKASKLTSEARKKRECELLERERIRALPMVQKELEQLRAKLHARLMFEEALPGPNMPKRQEPSMLLAGAAKSAFLHKDLQRYKRTMSKWVIVERDRLRKLVSELPDFDNMRLSIPMLATQR